MAKYPLASRCPHCGSQSIELLDRHRPASAKVAEPRWRCLSSRCGRAFKSTLGARHGFPAKSDKAA